MRMRKPDLGRRAPSQRDPVALAARGAVAAFTLVFVAASIVSLRWTLTHPHIAGWDQIQYVDLAVKDALIRRLEGAGALRDALFNDYRWMPPGIRLLAIPLTVLHRTSETDFRLFTLALFALSLLILFDAARRLSNPAVAAGAVAVIAVAPIWVRASEEFMSETAMIPAMAVALWCLVRECQADRSRIAPWLMGGALGFGLLARLNFAPFAAIILLMLGWLAWARQDIQRLLVTILVASLIAWPSYAYSGIRYVAYGRFAASWPFDELTASTPLAYACQYIKVLANSACGMPVLLLLPIAIAWVTWSLVRTGTTPEPHPANATPSLATRRFVGAGCGAMVLITLLPHIFGHNQNPRYLLSALPALSIFLASGAGLRLATLMSGTATIQAAIMLTLMLIPHKAAAVAEIDHTDLQALSWRSNLTCDYSEVVQAAAARTNRPVVKFYGVSGTINHVQIELAFLRAGVLAVVAPADLAHPKLADPQRSGADVVMVLNQPAAPWNHPFVADPNARLAEIRDGLLHSPHYFLSDAHVRGPPAVCGMTVFLAQKPSERAEQGSPPAAVMISTPP